MNKKTFIAILFAILFVGLLLWVGQREPAEEPVELSTEPLRLSYHGGMAIPGISYIIMESYDPSLLESGNPWTPETEVGWLPIFKNPDNTMASLRGQELVDVEESYARRMGVNAEQSPRSNTYFSFGEDDNIVVQGRMRVLASYLPSPVEVPASLPQSTFDHTGSLHYRYWEPLAEFFLKKYSRAIGFDEPVYSVAYGSKGMRVGYHEGAGSFQEQFVSYHFDRVDFSYDSSDSEESDNSHLTIRFTHDDFLEPAGNYPILTLEEAKAALDSGVYTSNLSNRELARVDLAPKAEEAVYVSLFYDKDNFNYTIPFYVFYIPRPLDLLDGFHPVSETQNGPDVYQQFFVPAIDLRYIENPEIFGPGFEQYAD